MEKIFYVSIAKQKHFITILQNAIKTKKMASQHFLHGYRFNVHGDFNNKHQILFTVWLIDSTGIRIRCFCAFPVDLIGERMMLAWKK